MAYINVLVRRSIKVWEKIWNLISYEYSLDNKIGRCIKKETKKAPLLLLYLLFTPTGSEKTSEKVDVKEGIYFGPDVSPDNPDVRSDDADVNSGKSLVGPNQFPDERDLPNFANVVKQYMDQMKTVGCVDVKLLAF